jgi:hypothetical protein
MIKERSARRHQLRHQPLHGRSENPPSSPGSHQPDGMLSRKPLQVKAVEENHAGESIGPALDEYVLRVQVQVIE